MSYEFRIGLMGSNWVTSPGPALIGKRHRLAEPAFPFTCTPAANQRARDALARARDPEADLASRSQAPEPEPGPQDVDSLLSEFRREDGLEQAPRPLEEGIPPPNQTGEGVDRHLEGVLSTMNAMSDRSRRLYPAEMSAAVQNMRGAPLAASYVQPRDAADADYMAAVEHELLRTRQLKRRGMRKSRRQ